MMTKHGIACAALLLLAAGCGQRRNDGNAATGPGSTNELANAFRSAPAETKGAIDDVQAAVAGNDDTKAFTTLYALQSRNDLTDAQRKVIAESMFQANVRLQAAAAAGNKDAQKVLEDYRGSR